MILSGIAYALLFSGIAAALSLAAETAATIGAGVATAAGTGAASGLGASVIGASGIGAGGTTAVIPAAASSLSAATIQGAAAAGGLGLSAAGLATNIVGQNQVAEASKKAEAARRSQAELTAFREKREVIRKAQAARAIALSNATAGGAEFSSALPGAQGQIGSEEARSIAAIGQNLSLGEQVFAANQKVTAGKQLIGTGTGLQDFGKQTVAAAPAIGQVGQTLFSGSNNYRAYGTA